MKNLRTLAAALLAATLLPSPAAAQVDDIPPVRYPAIPAQAADDRGFVPAGWLIDASVQGDLDHDARPDLALVLRMNERSNVLPVAFCGDSLDTNPRMLVVALAVAAGGYRKVAADHALIPRRDNPCAEDTFAPDNIEISNGVLRLSLERFMSMGSWSTGTTQFALRWQQGAMRLIGFDYSNLRRNTGCIQTLSVNFLTGRVRTTMGNIGTDDDRVRWSRVPRRPLRALDGIGDGLAFDPERLIERLPPCDVGGDE